MKKKSILIAAAVTIAAVVVVFAAAGSGAQGPHRSGSAQTRAAGAFASARKSIVRGVALWERRVAGFVSRIIRMYEGSPYSYENFKKAADDIGRASNIK